MPERLRIAQVITRLDRGGSSDMVIALCERLDPERFGVTLVTGPAADPAEQPAALAGRLGITAVECPHLAREIRPRADLRALLDLRSAFEKMRPHVVHAHTSKAGALARLAARLAARPAGVPAVYSPHGHLFYGYYGKVGTALVVLAERVLASVGRQTIAVLTDESRAEHLARGIGRFGQFVTIPSGIDLKRFVRDDAARRVMRRELRLAPEDFAAGWVGRFVEVKGPDVFIEACGLIAKDLPNAVFVLAGDGPLRSAVEERAAKLGIGERCRFLGRRKDVPAVLNACDAYVLSSRNEGLGLSVVESLACGTPVVAADVGGVRDVLEDGHFGLLVPYNARSKLFDAYASKNSYLTRETRGLADAVILLVKDETRRNVLVEAGLERAKDFDVDRMVNAFADLYEELAFERCGRRD